MAGIYVHIPFCKQACTYCDFHFSTNLSTQDQLTLAICDEIEQRKDELSSKPSTLYFGGGSPSILSDQNLDLIFKQLNRHFDLSGLIETTIETNPDDHSADKLAFWKSLGISRLSIGIQSFIERDLQWMNRAHNAKEASECVSLARDAGFRQLTLDLIYSIPKQSVEEWAQNIEKAINSGVNHISAYCLTVEEKTALAHQVNKGNVEEKSQEQTENEFHLLQDRLAEAGFMQYELSNFATEGNEALHNTNYWNGKPYLGIGPAAHSFDGHRTRRWNASNNAKYINALARNDNYWEKETLTNSERLNERIITSLRTSAGLQKSRLTPEEWQQVEKNMRIMPEQLKSMLTTRKNSIRINPRHWLLSDAIIRSLIIG
ncbi:MAG: radical SAM family heme chaperone HemW [Salibacteraceae bacterium]